MRRFVAVNVCILVEIPAPEPTIQPETDLEFAPVEIVNLGEAGNLLYLPMLHIGWSLAQS